MIPELTKQQIDLKGRAFAAGLEFRELAAQWDAEDAVDFPTVSSRMGELGFFGLTAPTEVGGKGGNCTDYLIAVSEAIRAAGSWVVGEPMFCTTGPGPSMLMMSDNAVVREKYLKDVVTGRLGCAIALTEPAHGSDLTHLEATITDGGDCYIVNGHKSYVTGAIYNELYAVFVRFDGITGAKGIGAIVVEKGAPGLELQKGPEFLGTRAIPHGDAIFTDVRVPKDNLIIGPGQFARLMTAFNMERLHNCAVSLGGMLGAYDEVAEHVRQRIVFGRPVIEFQAVYHALADISVTIEAHRLLSHRAAASAFEGRYPQMQEVTMAKLFGGTQIPLVTMKCLELMGGVGVTKGCRTERLHREAVTNVVAGGAPALLRNSIAATLFPDLRFSQMR